MFDYIVKDVMEVVGYLPIGILCGILAVAIYLVCVWHAGRKRHMEFYGVVSARSVSCSYVCDGFSV